MNSIDKFAREAMPIQAKEKASEKPAAKARPISKAASTSGWDFILVEQRQQIDIAIQESKDPDCFSSVKIHHSTQSKSLSRRRWKGPLRPSY